MIGIVGGIGPYAGVDLLKKVFDHTVAGSDQEHLDAVLISVSTKIGDRTEYLTGKIKENPAFAIAEVIYKLKNAGAVVVGIPCNTAHAPQIFDVIKSALKKNSVEITVLNMIEETAFFVKANYPDIRKVGVLSTTGTFRSEIYKVELEAIGCEVLVPSREMQEKLIHPAIYDKIFGIKTISNPVHPQARENLFQGLSFLKKQGAQAVVLGCTELPLAIPEREAMGMTMIDPTTVLARALINTVNPEKLKMTQTN